jgi:hypothetical protein
MKCCCVYTGPESLLYRWDIITLMELLTTRAVVQRSIIWCWMAFITLITPQDPLLSLRLFLGAPETSSPPPPHPLPCGIKMTQFGVKLIMVPTCAQCCAATSCPPPLSLSVDNLCGRPCSSFLHVSFLKGGSLEHCVVIFVFMSWFAGMLRS